MNLKPIKTWNINALPENTELICSDITAFMRENNLNHHIFQFELLVREAINNGIIHGCQSNPAQAIYVELICDEQAIRVKVRDTGPGFDWRSAVQNAIVNENGESGRGLILYYAYADQVEFNVNGNEVTLTHLLKT